jgi:hypothetical protein
MRRQLAKVAAAVAERQLSGGLFAFSSLYLLGLTLRAHAAMNTYCVYLGLTWPLVNDIEKGSKP